jgi:hypothetical protein
MIESNHRTVKKQESKLAKIIEGNRQPMSGANDKFKSDATSKRFHCEAKQTQNSSISMKLAWLTKIDKEADAVNKYPLLDILFLNAPPRVPNEWIAIPMYVFDLLFEAWREKEKETK